MWMLPLYLHVNQKSDYDDDIIKKMTKLKLKSHAYSHTMKKTHAKFHNNRYKTVRGVALTRGTNCLYQGSGKPEK